MKMAKRIVAVVLFIALVLSICPEPSFAANEPKVERYTVLVLDTSNEAGFLNEDLEDLYTADTAIEYVKTASIKFLTTIDNDSANNHIAIVSYKSTATIESNFTTNTSSLKNTINALYAGDNVRDISSGLDKADQLLKSIPDGSNIQKNVVLFTTGITNNGSYLYDGLFDKTTVGSNWARYGTEIHYYAYANYAISTGEVLKKQAKLYVVGLFQTMEGMPEEGVEIAEFFRLTASSLATSERYYFPLEDPEKIEVAFDEVAIDIMGYQLRAFSDSGFDIEKGKKLEFSVRLFKDNKIVQDWSTPALAISNENIITARIWGKSDDAYVVTVTAKNVGLSNLLISDSDSGASITLPITVNAGLDGVNSFWIDDVPVFYPNQWPDNDIPTNFYDRNGLYVKDFSYSKKTDGRYHVEFTAYNSCYHHGAVDIYDSNGNWVDSEQIKKYSDVEGIYDSGEYLWKMASGAIHDGVISYTAGTVTEKSPPIKFDVPAGGYFTISNNMKTSIGTYIYNVIDFVIMGTAATIEGLADVDTDSLHDQYIKSIYGTFMGDEELKREFIKCVTEQMEEFIWEDANAKISKTNACTNIKKLSADFMEATDVYLDHEFWLETTFGIGESVIEKFGGPYGWALSLLTDYQEYSNYIMQLTNMLQSTDSLPVFVYSPLVKQQISVNGVSVDGNGHVPSGTMLQVFRLYDKNLLDWFTTTDPNFDNREYTLYNICLVKDDKTVDPNGEVTVKIRIPQEKRQLYTLFRQERDGNWTKLNYHYQGEYLVFTTDHFSNYVLFPSNEKHDHAYATEVIAPTCKERGYTNYTCSRCGKTYEANFIDALGHDYKIVRTTEPNCVMFGTIESVCNRCGDNKKSYVEKLGHDYQNGKCTRCGEHDIEGCPSIQYKDVPTADNWAHEGIDYCIANGLMNGVGNGLFNPSGTVTRAQLVTILYRIAGSPKTFYQGTFMDVPRGQWYTDAVEWSAADGIVNGVGDGKFNPNGQITREQIATILYRYSGSPKVTGSLNAFPDWNNVSSFANDALIWATGESLINGVKSGNKTELQPKANATRAQIASIILRYQITEEPQSKQHTVTFDPNGGTVSLSNKSVTNGSSYGSLPTPSRNGYSFDGWYTASVGGKQITSSSTADLIANQTLYAHWTAKTYTVTFNANGGGVLLKNKSVSFGSSYGTLPTPERIAYSFDGWYTSSSGGTQITSSTIVNLNDNQTLYAHWVGQSHTVYFNENNGTVERKSITVINGSKYTLYTPTWDGYTFNGWYTSPSEGVPITSNTTVNLIADQTLYAHWIYNTHTVSFNANGGSVSTNSIIVTNGSTYGTLPTPTRNGFFFDGWYTKESGGTQITSSTTVYLTSNEELYAHWTEMPTITAVAVKTKPTKTSYYVGETLDLSGLVLTATYGNGKTETISSGFVCSPTELSSPGSKQITVTYSGKSTSFTINVLEDSIVSMSSSNTSFTVLDTGVQIARYPFNIQVGHNVTDLSVYILNDQTPKSFTVQTNSSATKITCISSDTSVATVSVAQNDNIATVTITPCLISYNTTKTATINIILNGTLNRTHSVSVYRPNPLTVTSSNSKLLDVEGNPFVDGDIWAVGTTDNPTLASSSSNTVDLTITTNSGYSIVCEVTVNHSADYSADETVLILLGPGLNYSIVGNLPADTMAPITDNYWDGSIIWGKTVYNGISGWVAMYRYP